mmetsp:Transcript_9511/g.19390  ORF Transcript_9511/g.19390 Transcript_9511/m.19390 type:complete len:210 (+) Transcript_9511:1039-1668(+)
MVLVKADALVPVHVPYADGLVVSSRHGKPAVRGELGAPHPVRVAVQATHELLAGEAPYLDGLVVRGGDDLLAVLAEGHAADAAGVALDAYGLALGAGEPEADGSVGRRRGDEVARRGVLDVVDGALVPDEAESAELRLEGPQHKVVVTAAGDELLHIGGEAHGSHRVLVAAEGALQGGIRDGGHGGCRAAWGRYRIRRSRSSWIGYRIY